MSSVKCFKCKKEYNESKKKLPADCLCPECKPIVSWVVIKFAIALIVIIFLIAIIASFVFAQVTYQDKLSNTSSNISSYEVINTNDTCPREGCNLANYTNYTLAVGNNSLNFSTDNSTEDFNGYTYEENLKDPLCFTRLNFCNLGMNITDNRNAQQIIETLKQVNYQQQRDLNSCSDESVNNGTNVIVLIICLIMSCIWAGYITYLWRKRRKD